jgi:DNA-binding NtrC family response regulator
LNVRIIAATHRDLAKDVAEGRFREDLFHRLAVGILNLPALRERDGDLELLIDHLLDQINHDAAEKPEAQHKELSSEAKKLLLAQNWPGNIRELYHTLLRAVIWSSSATIEAADIQRSLLDIRKNDEGLLDRPLGKNFDLQELLDEISRHYIDRALQKSGTKKKRAAELLGFSNYQTLSNWASRLGVGLDEKD